VQSSQNIMAEIFAADISDKFLWILGKSGLHVVSFLFMTTSQFREGRGAICRIISKIKILPLKLKFI